MMTQQERDANDVWVEGMQDDGMFTEFLEGDFQQYASLNNGHSGLDTPMGRLGFGTSATDLTYTGAEQLNMHVTASNGPGGYRNHMPTSQPYTQYTQFQQMQMPPHYHVPPTPVSADMHPGKYAQQMGNNGQLLFDHQQVC